jgi:hypothetical protein
MSATDRRLYEIACSFPALKNKGVQDGRIPGISPNDFYDIDLSNWLYKGGGGLLSHGEFLILESLLNLCNPTLHDRFNLGEALQTLDPDNMHALCKAIVRTYNRK